MFNYRWSGNAGTDDDTGRPIIYDPSAFFAHNEYEIGIQKVFPPNLIDISFAYRCSAGLDRRISLHITN